MNRFYWARRLLKIPESIKKQPGVAAVTFAALHEVTAVIPLLIFYIMLQNTSYKPTFSDSVLEEGFTSILI